jgi:hypothetical protein
MTTRVLGMIAAAGLAVSACSPNTSSSERAAAAGGGAASTTAPASFINRVWVVAESEQVARGELRVFLAEGTLVMASSYGTPAFGTWSYEDGRLTITEEGLKYAVDILELGPDVFRIRIHSPGDPVVIRFAPAELPPLPGGWPPAAGR